MATVLQSALHLGPRDLSAQSVERDGRPAAVIDDGHLWLAGGMVASALLLIPADETIARSMRRPAIQEAGWISAPADGLRLLGFPGPIIATGGMYLVGRFTDRPGLADAGLHAGEAVGTAAMITIATKALVGRVRPHGEGARPGDVELGRGWLNDRYQSFPSGHATAAFAAASALTAEVAHHWPEARERAGIALFSTATLIAASRVFHDVHWASDAAAGAAIGTLVGGAVVRLAHAHPDNRLDRLFLATGFAAHPDGVVVGIALPAPW